MAIEGKQISRIAMHLTAEASLPALVSKGSSITRANWNTAVFETFNSKNLGDNDDYDLEADSVTITREITVDELMAARDLAPEDSTLISQRITALSFQVASVEESLWAFDSAVSQGSNITKLGTSITMRSVCIEVRGLALIEFENCLVTVEAMAGGSAEDGRMISTVTCTPHAGTNAAGGMQIHHYQA